MVAVISSWPLIVLAFAFWIWMLVDCIKNDRLGSIEKIVWVLVIIFLNGLGALIYYFAGRGDAGLDVNSKKRN